MTFSSKQLQITKTISYGFVLVFLAACANFSSSYFVPYTQQFAPTYSKIAQGKVEQSAIEFSEKTKGPNLVLNQLESARLFQLAGKIKKSQQQFEKVFYEIEQKESKARLSASDGAAQLGAIALNDNAIPFKPASFEKILAHHLQSYNYLAKGDLEGALVEVRRANEIQVLASESHEKEVDSAKRKANKNDLNDKLNELDEKMYQMVQAASQVKNAYDSAYTRYYAAILRETYGDTNGAYIDYKKALEIAPNNAFVAMDFFRLAQKLGMRDDLKSYAAFKSNLSSIPKQAGNLVIFYESGMVPAKEEFRLPFIINGRIYTMAFPTYNLPWHPKSALSIRSNSGSMLATQALSNTHALSAKALQEGNIARMVRQFLRLDAKARLQREAQERREGNSGDSFEAWMDLFATGYAALSERADLRAWLSLPKQIDTYRTSLPSGSHRIQISNATVSKTINVNIEKGKTTLIVLTNPSNQHLYQKTYIF